MLKVNLAELRRVGSLSLDESIPAGSELWKGSELDLGTGLATRLQILSAGSGEVVARGHLRGVLRKVCRRCLAEVEVVLEEEVDLLFVPPDELGEDRGDEVREIPHGAHDLDLAEAVREEVILAAPVYTVCREDCRGLCPQCGTNWNESTCDCTLNEPDPRWDALRALKEE